MQRVLFTPGEIPEVVYSIKKPTEYTIGSFMYLPHSGNWYMLVNNRSNLANFPFKWIKVHHDFVSKDMVVMVALLL